MLGITYGRPNLYILGQAENKALTSTGRGKVPDNHSHGLQPGRYVSVSDFGRVGLQQVRLRGLDVGDAGDHPLPEAEQVVDGVGRELPHVQRFDGELGDQLDRLWVVVDGDELAKLVVGLQTRKKPATSQNNDSLLALRCKKMNH